MESGKEIEMMLYLGTGIMVFFALGLILLVISYQRHFFKMKKQEAEAMLHATLETEKNERARIAADLHDSVQGDLSAIRIYLNVLGRRIQSEADKEVVKEIKESVDAALQNTRSISHNLMPPLLEAEGLVAAVTAYLTGTAQKAGIAVTVSDAGFARLPSSQEYQLFRTVQELTANVLKYSGAASLSFTFGCSEGHYTIAIEDDGKPFNFYAAHAVSKGAGLRNILSRLEAAGAVLTQPHAQKNHLIIRIRQTRQ